MKSCLSFACLALVAGCRVHSGVAAPPSGDDDVAPPSPSQQYLAADFKADAVDAICDWFIRCSADVGAPFVDHPTCEVVIGFAFGRSINETGSFADPLLYRIDIAKADACIAKVNATACTADPPLVEDVPECVAAFTGRLNAGECCDRRGGCAPGLVCERAGETGVCSAAGAPGDTCFEQTCAAPAICATVRNGDRVESQCVVPLGLGAGETCENTFDCLPAFSCQQFDGSAQRKCLLRPSTGDFCFHGDLQCAAGLFCTGVPGATPRCSTTRAAEGAVCILDGDCEAGLICDQTGFSENYCLRPGTNGQACAGTTRRACADGLGCIAGTCVVVPVPKANGDPCLPDSDAPECPGVLVTGRCIDQGAGYVCVPAGRENEPCSSDGDGQCDIINGLFCDTVSSTCKQLPKVGEACPLRLCQPVFTVTCVGEGAAARCEPRRGAGEPCTADDEEQLVSECDFDTVCLADETTGVKTCQSFNATGGACK